MHHLFSIIVLSILIIGVVVITKWGRALTDEEYDRLKYIVERWPAITAFLGIIVTAFNPLYGAETITVAAGIGTLLAKFLDTSRKEYNKPDDMDVTGLDYLEDGTEDGEIDE